eukprot:TRINITY_DN11523_c0_g1_i1.p1 TRINITY_DN11523_c0_g1~~TRINITY_DN11523_c0_g1_i1.p1  ORF type:complete len:588 (+),score=120.92 TRINITY_DN11523_c0_g1_i1:32-1795(+)
MATVLPYKTEITLVVRATTVWGDRVAVVGNTPELGHWDWSKAKLLEVDAHTYPLWTTTFLAPLGEEVQYKYIIVSPSPLDSTKLKPLKWESHANRKITSSGSKMTVDDGHFGGSETTQVHVSQAWSAGEYQVRVKLGSYSPNLKPQDSLHIYSQDSSNFLVSIVPQKRELRLVNANPSIEGEEYVISASALEDLAFFINIYERGCKQKFARAAVTSDELKDKWGLLKRPLIDARLKVVGEITLYYLVITPFSHPENNLEQLPLHHWKPHAELIGHRGFGKSMHTFVAENTLLSFHTAEKFGLKYVEFDVQLTSDGIPVIYHNWRVQTQALKNQPVMTAIGDLSLEQFKSLDVRQQNGNFTPSTRRRSLKRTKSSPNMGAALNAQKWRITDKSFATLQQLYEELPETLGFNIEIKYPDRNLSKGLNVVERNEMVDTILQVTFDCAKKRPIFFSSFDPEICILLSKKQPHFPVFFLSEGKLKDRPYDKRSFNLEEAIKFCHGAGLRGIVCQATHILEHLDLIPDLHSKGLLLFSWGEINNEFESVKKQKEAYVDAIITDKITKISSVYAVPSSEVLDRTVMEASFSATK